MDNLNDAQHDIRSLSAELRLVRGIVEALLVHLPSQNLISPAFLGEEIRALREEESRYQARIEEDHINDIISDREN
jgi:hypothetical protein